MEGTGGKVEVKLCPICIKEILGTETTTSTKCQPINHTYHYSCLNRWLQEKNLICPMCRTPLMDTVIETESCKVGVGTAAEGKDGHADGPIKPGNDALVVRSGSEARLMGCTRTLSERWKSERCPYFRLCAACASA